MCIHFQVHESASAGRPASVGSLAVAWESAYRWAVAVTDLVLIDRLHRGSTDGFRSSSATPRRAAPAASPALLRYDTALARLVSQPLVGWLR